MRVEAFSNQSRSDLNSLRRFVDFQFDFYKGAAQFVPLLKYEYLGSTLLGMTGLYEARHGFSKHGETRFFTVKDGDKVVGRCHAAIDRNYIKHWKEDIGFIGSFECVDDADAAFALFEAAETWLKANGISKVRGPQNFPFNEATPGVMVEGFESRPVVYYHYNPPYYASLFEQSGYRRIKNVLSWEVSVQHNSIQANLERLSHRIIKRSKVTMEHWSDRPVATRMAEMFEVYNDAWNDNFGFIPFERDEFYANVKDMQLVMDKSLFLFAYVDGELAGFFGGVPNIAERMRPGPLSSRLEIVRAIKLLSTKSSIKGFRLGYLGVKKKFRKVGLDGVMLWKQSEVSKSRGYDYCDMGWVLEDNAATVNLIERCGGVLSKKYATFEKSLG